MSSGVGSNTRSYLNNVTGHLTSSVLACVWFKSPRLRYSSLCQRLSWDGMDVENDSLSFPGCFPWEKVSGDGTRRI